MATHDPITNTFTLDATELNFAIPFALPDTTPPARTPDNSGVRGNGLNNVITGDATNNDLYGEGGNDTLIGGGGSNFFDGGEGFDTVSYETVTGGVSVDLSATLPAFAPAIIDDTYVSIEGIIGSAFNDTIKGSDDVGELLQGGAGSDQIDGQDGNDTIIGGAGNDIMAGGAGSDTLSYANADTFVSIEMGSATGEAGTPYTGQGHNGEAEGDTNIGFENLIGSRFDDTLSGNYGHNSIDGGAGRDSLNGNVGNDTLNGGAGADIMQGLEDNDTYIVDNAADEIRERDGNGYDTAITSVSYDLAYQEVEELRATADAGSINLSGNEYANTIIGNDGNNVINGELKADTMIGKGGNDTYIVDNAGDVVTEDSAAGGYDLVNTSVSYALSANVEALTATGSGSIALNGNSLNNVITGNSGNNVIDGGVGADTMQGGAGDDVYYVDNIGDVIIDTVGTNTIFTTIDYKSSQFIGNVELIGSNNIEVVGNEAANVLRGNTGANRINGGKGNDVLFGGAGKDSFVFDSAIGTWKTNPKVNLDRIQDFTVKQDKLLLDNAIFKKLGAKTGKLKADFFKVGKASDKNDYLILSKNKKALSYDVDGSGSKKAVEIIKFDKAVNLTAADIWVI